MKNNPLKAKLGRIKKGWDSKEHPSFFKRQQPFTHGKESRISPFYESKREIFWEKSKYVIANIHNQKPKKIQNKKHI